MLSQRFWQRYPSVSANKRKPDRIVLMNVIGQDLQKDDPQLAKAKIPKITVTITPAYRES